MKELIICICTYKRNESLKKCLMSLEELKNPKKINIIILVVDNTKKYQSFNLIKKIKKKFKYKIIQINENKRGVVHARNKALKRLKKLKPGYVSFIDDDCTVNKSWLINILKILRSNKADIVTGPQIYFKEKKNINYTKYFEKKYNLDITRVKWAATNNVFFTYNIIKKEKLIFDKYLNKFGMGEDQLFFSTLSKKNYKIYWSKNVKVYERNHGHRTNIYWLIQRSFRLGVLGHYIDKKLNGNFYGYFINYFKSFYYLLFIPIFILTVFNKDSRTNIINYLFRFLGKLIGPIIFSKIDFLKKNK
ncbi:glycosyltransferase family 2 protein [Candidatus Pelagibacter sp.]|nr:glycosyltransferase family 2 protein [Candidatus Pelagibacter sp.]